MSKRIPISGAFTKGFIDGKGKNKMPPSFASYSRNARIRNGATTIRKGPKVMFTLGDTPREMHWNDGELIVATLSGKIYKAFPNPVVYLGQIQPNLEYTMFSQGKNTYILNGIESPRIYNQTDGLFNSTTTNVSVPSAGPQNAPYYPSDPAVENPNPIIGAALTGFTFIAGSGSGNKNILYISKPIVPGEDASGYNFSSYYSGSANQYDVGENRFLTSEILGMVANLDHLYIFCRETIEMLSRETVTQSDGVTSLYTIPIGDGGVLGGIHLACFAGDKIFYLTKDMNIKTIGYIPGVVNPRIGNLSDRTGQEINEYLKSVCDRDQRYGYAFYDKEEETIEFYLKKNNSSVNDIVLVYDLIHDTRHADDNKSFSCLSRGGSYGDKAFAGDFSTGRIYRDDLEFRDESSGVPRAIPFRYNTQHMSLGDPLAEKLFDGIQVAGGYNINGEITIEGRVDGKQQFAKTISRATQSQSDRGVFKMDDNFPTGTGSLFHFIPFEFEADENRLRKKGNYLQIRFIAEKLGCDFYLDTLAIRAMGTGKTELNDKY